jgi:hypothetical protein
MVKHKIGWCSQCRRHTVFCGTCGNNCCNAGYGEIEGQECSDCPDAHEKDQELCDVVYGSTLVPTD